MTNKILVVEDEEAIRGFIKVNLKRNNFDVIEAGSGEEALEKLDDSVDIVLLDVMLPGINGFEVCAKAREAFPQLGVIILTAKGQEENKIEGLEAGADDYIVKPLEMPEVIARVRAVFRRMAPDDAPEKLSFDNLVIDKQAYDLVIKGKRVDAPPKEIELLYFLASSPNRVFTRTQLLDDVWGFDYFGDTRTVDVHVKRLREKLEGVSDKWELKTVWGVGYKFETKE